MKQQFVQIETRDSLSRNELGEFFAYLEKKNKREMIEEPIPMRELSGLIEKNFVTPEDEPIPDCLSCGVCCSSVFFVQVSRNDPTPAESLWKIGVKGKSGELVVDQILRRNPETGRCMALEGVIGDSISCSIYENRPYLCRRFDAGSDKCHALRRAHGIAAPLSDQEIAMALLKLLQRDSAGNDGERMIYHAQFSETDVPDKYELVVLLENDTTVSLGIFDVSEIQWFESDFVPLSLNEAKELVKS